MKTPAVRLDFGAMFWRVFLVVAVIAEIGLWNKLRPFLFNRNTGFRVAAMILKSPRVLFVAFLIAALITVLIDLYVRHVMGPLMARWYAPRRDQEFGTPLAFRLESNEKILDEMPARRVQGRRAHAGTLVRTDRHLWFTPAAWHGEPWSLPLRDLGGLLSRPHHVRFGSLIRGLPDRVIVCDNEGGEAEFVVLDPDSLLDWFPDHAIRPIPDYEPSPLELL